MKKVMILALAVFALAATGLVPGVATADNGATTTHFGPVSYTTVSRRCGVSARTSTRPHRRRSTRTPRLARSSTGSLPVRTREPTLALVLGLEPSVRVCGTVHLRRNARGDRQRRRQLELGDRRLLPVGRGSAVGKGRSGALSFSPFRLFHSGLATGPRTARPLTWVDHLNRRCSMVSGSQPVKEEMATHERGDNISPRLQDVSTTAARSKLSRRTTGREYE